MNQGKVAQQILHGMHTKALNDVKRTTKVKCHKFLKIMNEINIKREIKNSEL